MTKKGRIYRVVDPARRDDPSVREVKMLLSEGMTSRSTDALAGLLAHADVRIRQDAQFELAGRGEDGWNALARIAGASEKTLPRIHALWGLEQSIRQTHGSHRERLWDIIAPLLIDRDAEVRAQAAKIAGETKEPKSFERLSVLLTDASPRARYFAAIALGKLGHPDAAGPLFALLRANADKDPYLRHAAVMGLVGCAPSETWVKAAHDDSPAVRMGVLLAMRRRLDPAIAGFLSDPEPRIVLEAARQLTMYQSPTHSRVSPRFGSMRLLACRSPAGCSMPISGLVRRNMPHGWPSWPRVRICPVGRVHWHSRCWPSGASHQGATR